jgi:hypothetical protein
MDQPRPRGQRKSTTPAVLSSFPSIAPFISRLVAQHVLANPMFTVTLQRDYLDFGGNVGQLSIGELPEGVSAESLTWVDVRGYPASERGLAPPPDSPEEVCPTHPCPLVPIWLNMAD